ncbi:unnamed protein product [Dicrocoelium dendriticum]|nr:unnamed protein product [Dicrocoelium dendriticum]
MEVTLAGLAVYDSSDLLRRLKSIFSALARNVLDIPTEIYLALFFGLLVMIATALWSRRPHTLAVGVKRGRGSHPFSFETYLAEWLKVYVDQAKSDPASWMLALLIPQINFELTRLIGSAVSVHDIILNSTPHYQIIHMSSELLGDITESVATTAVFLPSVTIYAQISLSDSSALYCTLKASVKSKVKFFISHRDADLLIVNMYTLPDTELCPISHSPDFDVDWFKNLLVNALQRCKVAWTPETPSTFTHAAANLTGELSRTSVWRTKSSESSDPAFPPPSDPDPLPCADGQVVSCIGTATSTDLVYGTSNVCLTGHIAAGSNARVFPDDYIGCSQDARNVSSYSLANHTEDPVVLPYSTRIHQSITASQLPKKSRPRFPRSASYYGESTSFNANSEDINDAYEGSCERLLHLLPNSVSTGFKPPITSEVISHNTQRISGRNLEDLEPVNDPYGSPLSSRAFESALLPRKPKAAASTKTKMSCPMDNRKLLIKVVKADGLILKGTSNAYCVVELDEPYQRHTTHCSSAGQLFWDQHLLFDLNNNSKRVALEVYELAKRKKSVSKGRTELFLPSLLITSANIDSVKPSAPESTSEFRRRLPLLERPESPLFALTDTSAAGGIQLGHVVSDFSFPTAPLQGHNPAITVEFHFMERTSEESLANRLRLHGEFSPVPAVQRVYSFRAGLQSFSTHDSPVLGLTVPSESLSHSTSLEFPVTNFVPSKDVSGLVDGHTAQESAQSDNGVDSVLQANAESPTVTTSCGAELHRSGYLPTSPVLLTSKILSPIPPNWALLEEVVGSDPTARDSQSTSFGFAESELLLTRSPTRSDTTFDLSESQEEAPSSTCIEQLRDTCPVEEPISEDTHRFDKEETGDSASSGSWKKSDLHANVIGSSSQQGSTFLDSEFTGSKDDHSSSSTSTLPNFSPRSHSLASRLKSSRLLSPGVMKSSKRTGDDSGVGGPNSLALLGPSRHLAGVVASLSTLPTDPRTSPLDAAALASAIAVAGATGNWKREALIQGQAPRVTTARVERYNVTTFENPAHDPPVHHLPPAASVAAESPGTYTAFSQPRRSEANLSLLRLFRHRKKRFRSVEAEKLLYLESMDLGDLDAISTEGYYRIIQDDETDNQDS